MIVRFLSNETRVLEVLLSALEDAEREGGWDWEQRYVVLLWLSQLMLVPFDLSSISSAEVEREGEDVDGEGRGLVVAEGFEWPRGAVVPGITKRILPLAIRYLGEPGKERDAARAVLVRIAMRRDMQGLGVLDSLVGWAVRAVGERDGGGGRGEGKDRTPYFYIGVLGFLSGVLGSSADTSDMDRYLARIFYAVHGAVEGAGEREDGGSIVASALARKAVIKVIRAIAVLTLRNPGGDEGGMELVETTIGFLLENLADNDTPVRFAASKALSIITLKLDADMATQVVEAVIESLNRNVLWTKDPKDPSAPRRKDLNAVNPLEWHGLMLTLSHLLYRRSPPADNLPDIIHALIMGLSFERRNTSGGSMGTNVRDAACFGIWALARRYSTKELLAVPTTERLYKKKEGTSIIQILATELIMAACLDPAGNLRRGSSAALQELVGRHPDTVENGIAVVQAVDYHSVALRARAVQEVSLAVTKLAGQYGEAILEALLGWRGIGDVDAGSRRAAGVAYGTITAELARAPGGSVERLAMSVSLVLDYVKSLQARQVEERHGLLLGFAAVLDSVPGVVDAGKVLLGGAEFKGFVRDSIEALVQILSDCQSKTYRRPELIAEAASRLIVSSFPVLQAATIGADDIEIDVETRKLLPGAILVSDDNAGISNRVKAIKSIPEPVQKVVSFTKANLTNWLTRTEEEVLSAASDAALVMLVFSGKEECENIIKDWVEKVRHRPSSGARTNSTTGYFSALTKPHQVVSTLDTHSRDEAENLVSVAITERWRNDRDVDTHVAILKSLTGTGTLRNSVGLFIELIAEGLDDYTTNARGDVGSLVRLQAIRATRWIWEEFKANGGGGQKEGGLWRGVVSKLFLRIIRLAAEKLDRVRVEAQAALAVVLKLAEREKLGRDTFSSKGYFRFLLDLLSHGEEWMEEDVSGEVRRDPDLWMEELLAGLVSSADTGNEDLVIATRAALCEFCEHSSENSQAVCAALVRNLKSRQGQDRVLVPTLEVTAFLFYVGIFAKCRDGGVDYTNMCLQVQKACYKTGNVRKIEACIRVYGAVASGLGRGSGEEEGVKEARKRLGALMLHPWPRVRSLVVDEIWGWSVTVGAVSAPGDLGMKGGDVVVKEVMGVDWGKAEKGAIKAMVKSVGFE